MTDEDEVAKAEDARRATLRSLAIAQNRVVEAEREVEVARKAWFDACDALRAMKEVGHDDD